MAQAVVCRTAPCRLLSPWSWLLFLQLIESLYMELLDSIMTWVFMLDHTSLRTCTFMTWQHLKNDILLCMWRFNVVMSCDKSHGEHSQTSCMTSNPLAQESCWHHREPGLVRHKQVVCLELACLGTYSRLVYKVRKRAIQHDTISHSKTHIEVWANYEQYKNSFLPRTIKDWNTLPINLVLLPSVDGSLPSTEKGSVDTSETFTDFNCV